MPLSENSPTISRTLLKIVFLIGYTQFKNDGYIIPEDLKENIFEPFFRNKNTDAKTGSCIGLASARSLALIHSGSLTLESPENEQNVFLLTLPFSNL